MKHRNKTDYDYREVTFNGERVIHLYPNDCYYAHLSIYSFARQLCQNKIVLDAGSGTGYGSAYLANNGARLVWGIEASEIAKDFSESYFKRNNLKYKLMDLQKICGFDENYFDVIFSSNVLEHVPNVMSFFFSGVKLIKEDGMLILAVPPVVREGDWDENIRNIYHLNIWTPRQWHAVVNMFFEEVECFWHGFDKPGVFLDFNHTPEQTKVNEEDFLFNKISLDDFYTRPPLTVVFLARRPKKQGYPASESWGLPFLENSFTRPPHTESEINSVMNRRHSFFTVIKRLINF